MPLSAGTRLGQYEILSAIGAGGMGEVYQAHDTRLDRTVAVKALPADRLADDERKRRFLIEARAASALNHPNIVVIHDFAAANGAEFLVMEFVPGRTLQDCIPKKGMPLQDALRIGIQIADALAAAHAAGIVHRDLKPGNVMVRPDGIVKLLDFGLAKLVEPDPSGAGAATMTGATAEGTIAGTVSYMSPEQAEAKPLDGRTDIFSFGSVMYEMLTGRRAFDGESAVRTLSAILNAEPTAVSGLAHHLPDEVERVIRRCLRKNPERRFQTAKDLKVALQELLEESDVPGSAVAEVQLPRRKARWIAGAATVGLIGAAAGWLWARSREGPAPTMLETRLTAYEGFESHPAFSPDGNQVAFIWRREGETGSDVYVRLIGAGQPVQLTNTPEGEVAPAWSPDGRWIAFLRLLPDAITVFVMPSIGGGERRVAEIGNVRMAAAGLFAVPPIRWTPDSTGLVVTGRTDPGVALGLILIDVASGQKRRLTSPPAQQVDVGGAFSPDRRQVAFFRVSSGNPQGNIYVLSVDANLAAVGEPTALTNDAAQLGAPEWTADGQELLFPSNRGGQNGLWRVPASGGTPVRLPLAGSDPRQPTIRGGRLAYVQTVNDSNIWAMPTSGVGDPVRLVTSTLRDLAPQYSPDGSRLAFCSDQSGTLEIWVARSDGTRPEKLTSWGAGESCTPRWSPDSRQLVFDSNGPAGQFEVYLLSADGGQPKRLTNHPETDAIASFSRDGQWIYFMSNRTGRAEVWKLPVGGGEPIQVTANGGYVALESSDGQTLFYTKGQAGALWKMPTAGGSETKVLESVYARNFAPSPEGIYFMEPTPPAISFRFLDFATGNVRTIGSMTRGSSNVVSVSPDGRWFAYVQVDQAGSDIVLVENFR